MSSRTWRELYPIIRELDKQIPRDGRRKRYSDVQIVAMYLWAALHDRPQCWAVARENYGRLFRPRRLPSRSQFNRRIKSPRCEALIQAVNQHLAKDAPRDVLMVDGRALRVGPHSQDRDARRGWASGGYATGYKMHAIASENGVILTSRVLPMNVSEVTAAAELIAEIRPSGVLLADGGYDAGHLYEQVHACGGQLLTPLPAGVGKGHRTPSAARLKAATLWASGAAAALYPKRTGIERIFSQQSSFGGGLAPLPPWVRGLERVRRWVTAKTIIYHLRRRLRGNQVA